MPYNEISILKQTGDEIMNQLSIAVLFGGVSTEHEISLLSAASLLAHMDREKYTVYPVGITRDGRWLYLEGEEYDLLPQGRWEKEGRTVPAAISPDRSVGGLLIFRPEGVETVRLDCVLPVLHGLGGEDGAIQGLLEYSGVPYVGCGIAASACSMDKSLTKQIIDHTPVRQAAYVLCRRGEFERDAAAVCRRVEETLGAFPVFVKPCSSGSSVGVHKAQNAQELADGLRDAFTYDPKVIVEEFICGREIEVAVIGNDAPTATPAGEIAPAEDFYTFDAKYVLGTSSLFIPARLSGEEMERVRQAALTVYTALDCAGLSRVDFFCQEDGTVIFNEINTFPGFTSISMYPKLMEHEGVGYEALIDRLIDLARERKRHG